MALVIGSGITVGGGITVANENTVQDPYFANVSLLLTGQGTDGSSAIVDSSSNAWTIANSSNLVKYNATSPQVGSTSMRFSGTGNYLRIPQTGVANFGSGNFTIEGWMKFDSFASTQTILWLNGAPGINVFAGIRVDLNNTSPGLFRQLIGYTGTSWATSTLYTTTVMSTNTWYYYTMVRNGTTIKVYVNGVAEATYTVGANSIYSAAENWISAKNTGTALSPTVYQPITGYIEQLRITTGVARYTADFTPPNTLMPTS
jgi:hypothetical protein